MNKFLEEILEQPDALEKTYNFYYNEEDGKFLLQSAYIHIKNYNIKHVVITGMGSSYFNSLILYYYLNSKGFSCEIIDTGELYQYFKPKNLETLYIFVSQSGESGEVLRTFDTWGKSFLKSNLIWGITNTPKSTLGKTASLVFPTLAGHETSVTSKTYTTGLLVSYLLARAIMGELIIDKEMENEINSLLSIMRNDFTVTNGRFPLQNLGSLINTHLGDTNFMNFIGQGCSLSTVYQSTLNFKETCKLYAEGISIGMFRHGPIESISESFRCIIIISDKNAVNEVIPVIENIMGKWGGGKVVLLTNYEVNLSNDKLLVIQNPVKNSFLAPILEMIIMQQYIYVRTEELGIIPGKFTNTKKITK